MFALLSIVSGCILIYNISMINIKDRSVELGTLRVLGMTERELGSILLTEKLIYYAAGVMMGFPGSYGVNRLLEILIISDNFDLRLYVPPSEYVLTAVLCLLMILCSWYAAQRVVREIDLTETLKAKE